jgi:hypothetical protein
MLTICCTSCEVKDGAQTQAEVNQLCLWHKQAAEQRNAVEYKVRFLEDWMRLQMKKTQIEAHYRVELFIVQPLILYGKS